MPRPLRTIVANQCYHVINRGNQKARVFHSEHDYSAFLAVMNEAQERVLLPVLAACLMPNHIHLVVQPLGKSDLSAWMSWMLTTFVRRQHQKYSGAGRLWQGRYKAFHIQQDHHLLAVLRYVERNALSAHLVTRAEHWRWGSLHWRALPAPPVAMAPLPIPLPGYWPEFVNQPMTAAELREIRICVNRQRPFGAQEWVETCAKDFGTECSLSPRGRPRRSR